MIISGTISKFSHKIQFLMKWPFSNAYFMPFYGKTTGSILLGSKKTVTWVRKCKIKCWLIKVPCLKEQRFFNKFKAHDDSIVI